MTKAEREKMTEAEKALREARNYEKFQSKVNRLTEYAHVRRMMARLEYQMKKEEEERKARKGAAGKTETAL